MFSKYTNDVVAPLREGSPELLFALVFTSLYRVFLSTARSESANLSRK